MALYVHRWRAFIVDFATYRAKCGAGVVARLEGETHADYFERVSKEDGDAAGRGAAREAPHGCLLGVVFYKACADLFICQKLDPSVGKYAEEGGRVAFEEAADAVFDVYVLYGYR
jgi:hypothetical protein